MIPASRQFVLAWKSLLPVMLLVLLTVRLMGSPRWLDVPCRKLHWLFQVVGSGRNRWEALLWLR